MIKLKVYNNIMGDYNHLHLNEIIDSNFTRNGKKEFIER